MNPYGVLEKELHAPRLRASQVLERELDTPRTDPFQGRFKNSSSPLGKVLMQNLKKVLCLRIITEHAFGGLKGVDDLLT